MPLIGSCAPAMQSEPPSVSALYAFILGCVASGSLIIALLQHESAPNLTPFAAYMGSLALFHFLEYYWQAKYHPETTTSEGKKNRKLIDTYRLPLCILNYYNYS